MKSTSILESSSSYANRELAVTEVKQVKRFDTGEFKNFWVPLFGFFILMSESGVRQIMNVFVAPIIVDFNCTKTEADTAMIAMPTASSLLAGPVAAVIYHAMGPSFSICTGAAMCFVGFLSGSFASNIYILFFCALLIGLGCALMRNSVISVQCEYFKKNRNVAMGFVAIGPGIGIFMLPRMIMPLMAITSWQAIFRLISTFYIISFVMGIFLNKRTCNRSQTFWQITGFKVWKSHEFVLHVIASFCASCVCIIYLSNILSLMRESNIKYPERVYSFQGIASILGRIALTTVMGCFNIHIGYVMIANYIIAQTSLFSAAFCFERWQFILQNFTSGFGMGMFQATLGPFLVAIVGPCQLPEALGYTNLLNGAAAFSTVNIAGPLVGFSENPRSAFYLAIVLGFLAIVSSIITTIVLITKQRREQQKKRIDEEKAEELKALNE